MAEQTIKLNMSTTTAGTIKKMQEEKEAYKTAILRTVKTLAGTSQVANSLADINNKEQRKNLKVLALSTLNKLIVIVEFIETTDMYVSKTEKKYLYHIISQLVVKYMSRLINFYSAQPRPV